MLANREIYHWHARNASGWWRVWESAIASGAIFVALISPAAQKGVGGRGREGFLWIVAADALKLQPR